MGNLTISRRIKRATTVILVPTLAFAKVLARKWEDGEGVVVRKEGDATETLLAVMCTETAPTYIQLTLEDGSFFMILSSKGFTSTDAVISAIVAHPHVDCVCSPRTKVFLTPYFSVIKMQRTNKGLPTKQIEIYIPPAVEGTIIEASKVEQYRIQTGEKER